MNKNGLKRILLITVLVLFTGFICSDTLSVQARTIINNPPYYDQELDCYVQVTVETYTEYDANLRLNRNMKKTITVCYKYENDVYILISQNEQEEIISYEPVSSVSPAATVQPQVTASPSVSVGPSHTPFRSTQPTLRPAATPTAAPTATPEPLQDYAPAVSATRKSSTQATIKWDPVDNADGYIIYRSLKEKGSYARIKKIKDIAITSYKDKKLKSSGTYYYKVRGYQKVGNENNYTDMSEPCQVTTLAVKKLVAKLKKLKTKYPDGMYWNHAGYTVSTGQNVDGFVTNRPCTHNGTLTVSGKTLNNISSTCNYYRYTVNGKAVRGYQCAGFAAMLSDKIMGKSGFRSHSNYNKAQVGDCVRYLNQHSALIIEKHADYIKVAECNYGNTCKIKWGRKIQKSSLNGAVYYTKRAV